MIGYPYQSWTRQVITLVVGAFIAVVAGSFVCALLRPLLPVFLSVAGIGLIVALFLRWRLFRYRGW